MFPEILKAGLLGCASNFENILNIKFMASYPHSFAYLVGTVSVERYMCLKKRRSVCECFLFLLNALSSGSRHVFDMRWPVSHY